MRKIIVEIDTGFVGAVHRIPIEVDDDATDGEINQIAEDLVWEHISVDWSEE